MKQAGKAHWLTIVGIVSALVVVGLFFFGKDAAAETSGDFMAALAGGDVDRLTDLSYYQGGSKEDLRKQWDFAVNEAGPYYRFVWRIERISYSDPETAAATLTVIRNADNESGYEEKYQLPLVKDGGDWKVDVRAINRGLFPGLPR